MARLNTDTFAKIFGVGNKQLLVQRGGQSDTKEERYDIKLTTCIDGVFIAFAIPMVYGVRELMFDNYSQVQAEQFIEAAESGALGQEIKA